MLYEDAPEGQGQYHGYLVTIDDALQWIHEWQQCNAMRFHILPIMNQYIKCMQFLQVHQV